MVTRSVGWEHLSLPCAPWILVRAVAQDDAVMAGEAYAGSANPLRHVVRLDGRRMTTVRDAIHELSAALQLLDDLPGYGANLIEEALGDVVRATSVTELVLIVAHPDRIEGLRSLIRAADLAGASLMREAIAFHAVFETRSETEAAWLRRELEAAATDYGRLPSADRPAE